MTLPKNLQEKRDAMCEAYKQECLDNWHSPGLYLKPDFKKGFEEACKLLLPEIEKLSEVITILGDKHIGMAMCFEKHGTRLNIPFLIDDCKNDAQRAEKALQSLREFLGSEEEK